MRWRLDALEAKSSVVEDRLDKVDGSLETMSTSMSTQFAAVMQSLAGLADMHRAQAEAEPRKRSAVQPFSSSGQKS